MPDINLMGRAITHFLDISVVFLFKNADGFRLMELPTPQQQTTIPAKEISYSISPTRDGPVKEG